MACSGLVAALSIGVFIALTGPMSATHSRADSCHSLSNFLGLIIIVSAIAAAQTASAPTAIPDISQPIVMPRSNANSSITFGSRSRGKVGGSNLAQRSTGSMGSTANSAV